MTPFKWGFLGTGNIARAMACALGHVPGAVRHAVASRSKAKAARFAVDHGFVHAFGCYDALLADPAIDIVYIATPNGLHKTHILAALSAGKHVLCEKPMTLSVQDSAECFAVARAADLMLMEAFWTAFFPAMQRAVDIVQSGEIGTPQHLSANFVSYRTAKTNPILFDPELGGGARNDLGIYPVAAAYLLAGPIASVQSLEIMGSTGVDEMTAFTVEHSNGALSLLSCGFRAELPIALRCVGDSGTLEILDNFHRPDHVRLTKGAHQQMFDLPYLGNGYAHEAIAFQDYIAKKNQRLLWPPEASLAAMDALTT